MKCIETFYQATMRAIFLIIAVPTFSLAGMHIDNTFRFSSDEIVKFIALFIVSLAGGISSAFIKTSFDKNMTYPNLAKIWVGTALGTVSGLMMMEYFKLGLFSSLLPSLLIASLGAPIMVFYLVWFGNEEMQAEIKKKLKDKIGMNRE